MEPRTATFDDLGGGLHQGESAHEIADNQFVLLDNFNPFGRRFIRRNGSYRKTHTPAANILTGLFIHRALDGTPTPIFGNPQGFSRFVPAVGFPLGLIASIPQVPLAGPNDEAPYAPTFSVKPWVMVELNGVIYAFREQNTYALRVTPTGWMKMGIAPPSHAPTIAINASGVMTAGDRTVRVTFRNTTTGAESDLSDESNTITLGDDDSVDVTAIAISSNPQVNQRRLWINAPGTTGVWLLAGTLDNNTATTANINKAVAQLGAVASRNNGLPPQNLRVGDTFLDGYLVVSDGMDVFISEALRPESFSAFSVFNVFRGDGHAVTAIRAFKRQLLIGKTNKIHVFTKNGTQWSRDTLSEKHGFYSQHSVQVAGDFVIGYGGDDFYMTDGNTVNGIGSVRVKKLLARIPSSRKEFVSAVVYPKYSLYIAFAHVDPNFLADPTAEIDDGTYPTPPPPSDPVGADDNNVAIVYNYRTNAWATWTWDSTLHAPMHAVFDHDADFEQALFAIFYDAHYYQLDRGRRDATHLIRARARSKAFRLGPGHGLKAAVRRLFFHITTVAASITLRLYKDRESVAAKERTGLTLYDADYPIVRDDKGFNMRTSQKGALWQWEMEYEAEPPIEVSSATVEYIPVAQRVRMR